MTTTPSQDAMRAAFESWFLQSGGLQSELIRDIETGAYCYGSIRREFAIWTASAAHATKVERERVTAMLGEEIANHAEWYVTDIENLIDRITKGT